LEVRIDGTRGKIDWTKPVLWLFAACLIVLIVLPMSGRRSPRSPEIPGPRRLLVHLSGAVVGGDEAKARLGNWR
jgi:hypothetical protein